MVEPRDLKQILRQVEDLKRRSRALRDRSELKLAVEPLRRAINELEREISRRDPGMESVDDSAPQDIRDLAAQLADCYGSLGGILRREAASKEPAARQTALRQALDAYRKGKMLEQNDAYRISNSYNQVQWLVLGVLLDPALIAGEDPGMKDELARTIQILRRQIMTGRRQDPWAHSDAGLILTLLGDEPGAERAWDEVDELDPIPSVYSSGLAVLKDLAAVLPGHGPLRKAVRHFEIRVAHSEAIK